MDGRILHLCEVAAILLVVGARRPGKETIHYPDDDFGPVRK